MRLRTFSQYAEAIKAALPFEEDQAMDYGVVALATAERLDLTEVELAALRASGRRLANQHRSSLSCVLFGMKRRGEIVCSGRRKTKYWRPRMRYAGAGPTVEQIAERAYAIFEARGREHGRDEQDWLQAERELRRG